MSRTHWGYEYLRRMTEMEQAYLDEMLRELSPESFLALALKDMKQRLGCGAAIAADETLKQERFLSGHAEAPARPKPRNALLRLAGALHTS